MPEAPLEGSKCAWCTKPVKPEEALSRVIRSRYASRYSRFTSSREARVNPPKIFCSEACVMAYQTDADL